ncbi:hypothetical protein L228DRAFT_279190 [Xylona heveae TC161]|uniref:P/Homo B domain-containing protein n=1 Tax=Xylona heveae (strain CBS 132557 / TC161) TaxID=1328760 RepID=A0A165J9D8_XYLHT|nr:hypothetical protein L228DRAFT_279190 [Xylona heveae TC161]KZF25928.1 hypothetical protein L228DRAFT_279190 [Xylona heveae TC161]
MRLLVQFALLALACTAEASSHIRRSYETHDYYALHLDTSASPSEVAALLGLDHEGPLGELKDHHIFSSLKHEGDRVDEAKQELRRRRRKREESVGLELLDSVSFSQKQEARKRLHKRAIPPILERNAAPPVDLNQGPPKDSSLAELDNLATALDIKDPIFKDQWHLFNPAQKGHDVNVTGVWKQGITGHNATVAIIDDGLDMYSDDLKDNYFAAGSYDFNDQTAEPKPRLSDDRHGTRCAGEIAAVKNNVCGVGVAWDSKVAGIRILSKQISDADEAAAMNYAYQENQIYSCSWGPADDGRSMDAPGILIKRAMVNAVQNGRHGLGSIYVFASGNGAANQDNCNFDGYTNSIYSITVGAIDRKGLHPYYSEKCSAQLVVTYSSGSGDAIHTTDVGQNQCYAQHGGTSAAAPLAAGIFALVLSVRPDLTWRDMQYLALDTAVPVNEEDGSWQDTPNGKKFSHTFGYGKIDAYAIVEAAKTFESVKPQAWLNSPWMHVKHPIPQGDQGLASTFEITKEMLGEANLETLEHVTVTMNVEHRRRGDLSVELRSPSGVVSHLSATRKGDTAEVGYVDWTFMSVAHWGESGIGTWTVVVKDTVENEFSGNFTDWKLTLWGQSIDPAKQDLLPFPTSHDDDDHDVISSVPVSTASVPVTTQSALPTGNPTDHINRPINSKIGAESSSTPSSSLASTTPSASPTASVPATSTATPVPAEGDKQDEVEDDKDKDKGESNHFLPSLSFLPTFGVSKRTQIWIYASLVLIIIFCTALATYFFLVRRKRRMTMAGDSSRRDDYEFAMLDNRDDLDDDDHGGIYRDNDYHGNGRANGANGAAKDKGKKRGGELYDAFAGESDEDGVMFSDEEEDEDAHSRGYRDHDDDDHTHIQETRSDEHDGDNDDDDDDDDDEKQRLTH